MAGISVQNKIYKEVKHEKPFNFKSLNSCMSVQINKHLLQKKRGSLLKPRNQTTTSRHKMYFFPPRRSTTATIHQRNSSALLPSEMKEIRLQTKFPLHLP